MPPNLIRHPIRWFREEKMWHWIYYSRSPQKPVWVFTPLLWLIPVLFFGLPWWFLLMPVILPFIDWQNKEHDFDRLGLRIYWWSKTKEMGWRDND